MWIYNDPFSKGLLFYITRNNRLLINRDNSNRIVKYQVLIGNFSLPVYLEEKLFCRKLDMMNKSESWIMIIDDNSSDLELIERAFALVAGKYKLLCMNSGREALAYLQGEGKFSDRATNPYPSMLITDIKMPGVDGFEILENLQNNPSRAVIPTVVLSSSEDPDDIVTAYKLGAYSYFVKPYRYNELCDLVNNLLHYWNSTKTPQKDRNGKLILTNSSGKLGARYSSNN